MRPLDLSRAFFRPRLKGGGSTPRLTFKRRVPSNTKAQIGAKYDKGLTTNAQCTPGTKPTQRGMSWKALSEGNLCCWCPSRRAVTGLGSEGLVNLSLSLAPAEL